MYRIWYSTESFANYVIDHTVLKSLSPKKSQLFESDAGKPAQFHTMPDHIRRILYLDAPDLIVENNGEPVLSVEITTEAGTGHNAFQRFSRIAAAAENGVPALYIFPEAAIIARRGAPPKWDVINPLVFRALDAVADIYGMPAILHYFPSDFRDFCDSPPSAPHKATKGLRFHYDIAKYPGCPDSSVKAFKGFFEAINEIVKAVERLGVKDGLASLRANLVLRRQRDAMRAEFARKAAGAPEASMSPLSAVSLVSTDYLLKYLSRYEGDDYKIGELLRSRAQTAIYQVNAAFRGDPYPGCLAAIDYLLCREGRTFEERRHNLILAFGRLSIDDGAATISITDERGSTIGDFFSCVKGATRHNLLTRNYEDLKPAEIPRYMMQVRYGSTYSKVKHIRVFSYFADAILFPDGALWRDA